VAWHGALLASADRGKSAVHCALDAVPPAVCRPSLRSVGERDESDETCPSLRVTADPDSRAESHDVHDR
jgi:hypothetical protein